MAEKYGKPHLTYEQQLALLVGRGLICSNRPAATAALERIGYYRLSAYVYPFRELLPPDEQRRASPTHYRAESIGAGTRFEDVLAVWEFDRSLRLVILDAVETIEIGLRTRLAYTLGARNPFGHLDPDHLSEKARMPASDASGTPSRHEQWLQGHLDDIEANSHEDYLRHNLHKYDQLPIWIAVETMSFGRLAALFQLLDPADQTRIAAGLSIGGKGLLISWLKTLNYLRNVCAHHARLWNRSLTYTLRKMTTSQVEEDLHHLCGPSPTKKVYSALAVTAYLVRRIDPASNWPMRARAHILSFPPIPVLDPAAQMGLPADWDREPLWR